METINWALLIGGGAIAGLLAGLFGIGGGVVMVPILVNLGLTSVQAVATSSLAIAIIASSGSWQNWRMGFLNPRRALFLGLPAVITAQVGVAIAENLAESWLLVAFGGLLILNMVLAGWRRQVIKRGRARASIKQLWRAYLLIGGLVGILAGLFGVGGGVIMVPLQIILLGEDIKPAVRNSLGAIVIASSASALGHAVADNVVWLGGIGLGLSGAISTQASTRFLPKLPDGFVVWGFYILMGFLSVNTFFEAWEKFQGIS
ncbi:MAG: sulfite exporter TauE/SafE family protein [Cyanobacteria bacterium P01_H01_bin.15]